MRFALIAMENVEKGLADAVWHLPVPSVLNG